MYQIIKSIDEKLFLSLNGNHSEFVDYIMLIASNLLLYIPIIIGVIIIGAIHHKNRGEYHPIASSIMLAGTLLLGVTLCFNFFPQLFSW